jgi:hypothetical protein
MALLGPALEFAMVKTRRRVQLRKNGGPPAAHAAFSVGSAIETAFRSNGTVVLNSYCKDTLNEQDAGALPTSPKLGLSWIPRIAVTYGRVVPHVPSSLMEPKGKKEILCVRRDCPILARILRFCERLTSNSDLRRSVSE